MRPGSGGLAQTRRQMSRRTSGTVRGRKSAARSRSSPPNGVLTHNGQISMGQHGPRDVARPSRAGAALVLVEPTLALGGLEAGLNRPARAGDLDKGGEVCALRRERQVEGQLIRLLERAPDQERFLPALTSAPERDTRPVIQAEAPWPRRRRSAASSHPWAPPWPSPRPAAGQGAAPR